MQDPDQFLSDEIVQRWPHWEPTPPQRRDWQELIKPYHARDVLAAVRKVALENDYKSPSLPSMRRELKRYSFARPLYMRVVYVQSETGAFHKVHIQSEQGISDELLTEMGMREARKLGEMYQGRWIAYTDKTDWDMCRKRREIQSAIIDGVKK